MPASKKGALPAAPNVAVQAVQSSPGPDLSVVPLKGLENIFRFWWFVFAMMLIGGLAGWLIQRSRPPVYEAVAQVSATIDYVRTGPMTQFEEDTAFNGVGDILVSNLVAQKVVDQAAAQAMKTNIGELRAASTLERRVNVWVIRLRDTDPRKAQLLANLWLEQGQAQLQESYVHALRAEQLDNSMRSLERCLAQSVEIEPTAAQCSKSQFAEIQTDLAAAGKTYAQEIQASLGLSPAISLGAVDRATLPSHPAIFGLGQLVLAGSLLGLLIGIWLVQLGIPARWIAS